jgi:NAD(P)H-flavin reductase
MYTPINPVDSSIHTGPNPWFLWHGMVFIIAFSVLMPIATFVILYDKDRFYRAHNVMGVVILVLLVLGWAFLAQGDSVEKNGAIYLSQNMSLVGSGHSVTGIIAKYVALAVCVSGVVLRAIQMPKKVRFVIRVAHGIVGVLIAVLGVFVVWNGWVRLGVTYLTILDTTPIVWSIGVLGCAGVYTWHIYKAQWEASKCPPLVGNTVLGSSPADIECVAQRECHPMSFGELVDLVKDSKFFIFNRTEVIVWDDSFIHPGGMSVVEPFLGRDITMVFSGQDTFHDIENRSTRLWSHSAQALEKLRSMRVGVLDSDTSTDVGRSENFSMDMYDEYEKSVGLIAGKMPANKAGDCVQFSIKIIDLVLFSCISIGSKLRLSLNYEASAVERTYTVAELSLVDRTVVFYIKIYPEGELTPLLNELSVNDTVFVSGLAQPVPLPRTNTRILLLAAGTGIVPMLSYMEAAGDDSEVTVLWWLRDQRDLFLEARIKAIARVREFVIFFTAPTDDQIPLIHPKCRIDHGRISCEILMPHIGAEPTTIVMSGPHGFVLAAGRMVNQTMAEGSVLLSLD